MRIELNGQPLDLVEDASISTLLEQAGLSDRRVAVEVNREIVPRSRHGQHRLAEGDRVEIVQALGGG
jgi:sulfur carrier protein